MGNVVMITYAALSHAISVVFDRCPDMLEIARFFKDFRRLRCGWVIRQNSAENALDTFLQISYNEDNRGNLSL
jgi:hypothetical protein